MRRKSKKVQKSKIPLIDFQRFKGKEVAIVEGKIVAEGKSSKAVFEKAKKLFPEKSSRDIILLSVPKEKIFIYVLL